MVEVELRRTTLRTAKRGRGGHFLKLNIIIRLLRWNHSPIRAEARISKQRLIREVESGTFAHLHTTLNKSRDEKLKYQIVSFSNWPGALLPASGTKRLRAFVTSRADTRGIGNCNPFTDSGCGFCLLRFRPGPILHYLGTHDKQLLRVLAAGQPSP